jgi:hypothetical protein
LFLPSLLRHREKKKGDPYQSAEISDECLRKYSGCFVSFRSFQIKEGRKKKTNYKIQTDPTEWHHCFAGQRTMKGVIYSNGIQNYNKKKKIENRNNFEYYLAFNIRRSQDFKRNAPT